MSLIKVVRTNILSQSNLSLERDSPLLLILYVVSITSLTNMNSKHFKLFDINIQLL